MLSIASALYTLVAFVAVIGLSMAVRSVQSLSGTTSLRAASGTSVDFQHDTADHKWKYKDDAGTVQVCVTEALSATLTNKTLTSPTLTTPTLTTPTITGGTNTALKSAFSTATVSAGYATDTYLAGSGIAMPAGGFLAGARYTCRFDMVKTAAGTAQFTIVVRIGTLGTTADAAILTFAFAVGTAAVDTGTFDVTVHFRTVGATTTAVLVGVAECRHALAATGLITTGASGQGQLAVVSSGFDSTIAGTTIGISVNGGASFSGTNTLAEAELRSY